MSWMILNTSLLISLLASIIVINTYSAVIRICMLILVYLSGSFIYMLFDFYFLGLTYIIVYVGAIAILFLFIIMMMPLRLDKSNSKGSKLMMILGMSSTSVLFSGCSASLPGTPIVSMEIPSWWTAFIYFNDVKSLGYTVYQGYPLCLILIGIALWMTMIGIILVTSQRF